ncbi:MAG: glycosyltransferase family 4 protein [Rhodobacteraceae bacterium]|nr:glycosyltransferase family 4 protein [Paracoccaceae bacterium]
MPELFVTNFNSNFTGVSATAAAVLRAQAARRAVALVGHPLPGCPAPITLSRARSLSREAPAGRGFAIWHVRRNTEMRAAIWARDVLGLPLRIVFTSAAQRRHSAFPRWLIGRMDAVIATTDAAARHVPNVHAVVPHGVDCAAFCPATDRAAAWRALGHGGTLGIATIGRIRPEKGTDRFVSAMIGLLPRLPGATALIVGRVTREHRRFADDLRSRIAAAGLTDRIVFAGECTAADLPALMRAMSLVVQLPRYEGFGMVPLEAMASGVPFIGTDAGHFRAFSGNGSAGIVIPPEAAADTAAAILCDPARHARMAQAARQRASATFSAETEAAGIEAVYAGLWSAG